MTLSTTTVRNTYSGSGSTGPFSFGYKITAASDLAVYKTTSAGAVSTLAYPTAYSVIGVGDAAGGSITLTTALAVGESLAIVRDVPTTQPTSLRTQGTFLPESHEDALDRLTMIAQQQDDALGSAVRLDPSLDPATHTLALIPETGKALVWQSSTALGNSAIDSSAVAIPGGGRTVSSVSAYLLNNALTNVLDWGAAGNGTTDDTTAIQAAATAAAANGTILYFPAGRTFKTTGTITVLSSFMGDGATISYHGAGTAFKIGNDASILANILGFTPNVVQAAKTATGWGTQNGFNIATSVGVQCLALYQSWVSIGQVQAFGVGFLEDGGVNGSAHCEFQFSHLFNNKINHKVTANATTGFCNQNLHSSGRMSFDDAEGTAVSGTRHILVDSVLSVINQHKWDMVSVEGNVPEYTVECYGANNYFRDMRWETQGVGAAVRLNGVNATKNEFTGGIDLNRVTFTFVNSASSGQTRVDSNDGIRWAPATLPGVVILGNGAGSSSPLITGLDAGKNPHGRSGSETDWSFQLGSQHLKGKAAADDPTTTTRIDIDFTTGNLTTLGQFIGSHYKAKGSVTTSGVAFSDVFTASAAGFYDYFLCVSASGSSAVMSTGRVQCDGAATVLSSASVTGANITVQIASQKLQVKRNDGTATTFNFTYSYTPL